MKAKFIRESIEFKRGKDPKDALNIGRFNTNPQLGEFHNLVISKGYIEDTPKDWPRKNEVEETSIMTFYKGDKKIYVHKPEWDEYYDEDDIWVEILEDKSTKRETETVEWFLEHPEWIK